MATDVERLVVRLEASQAKFEKQLAKANGTANRRARQIEARFAKMNKNIGNSFRGLAAIAGVGLSVRGFQDLTDAAIRVENALKVAGLSGEELTRVYDSLFASAQKNAAPLEALTELYSRGALVQSELGISTEELLGFTDKVAVALRVSGKSAQESSGSLLQLSQALGSGVVRAEEFNSILEGALPIAQAAAAGLKEAGGSVARLRQLVVDGKVSSEAFFRAFEAGASILDEKVAGAALTTSQRFQKMQNALIDTAGKFNEVFGITEKLGSGIGDLAEKVQNLGDYIERNRPRIDAFFDSIEGSWAKLESIKGGFRSALGLDVIDDFLAGTSLIEGRVGFLSEQQAEAQRRIDNAFGNRDQRINRAGKSGRVPATEISPVSLSEFKPASASKEKSDAYQREVRQITERTAAIEATTAAQRGLNPLIEDYGYAVNLAATRQELLNAAKREGMEITPQLRSAIEQLAMTYAMAGSEAAQLAAQQVGLRQSADAVRDIGRDALSGFISDLREGTNAAEALRNALGRVADRLLDIALDNLFLSPGQQPINLLAGIGGGVRRAGGGVVHGPGGPKSDKVPAMLSDGEYVVNAAATRRNRRLLDAVNSGAVPHLAGGGMVGGRSAGGSYAPQYNITIEGNAENGVEQKIVAAIAAYDRKRSPELVRGATGAAGRKFGLSVPTTRT